MLDLLLYVVAVVEVSLSHPANTIRLCSFMSKIPFLSWAVVVVEAFFVVQHSDLGLVAAVASFHQHLWLLQQQVFELQALVFWVNC